ncbi:MAG: terminase large subunit [Acidobacteria bacterium]|nr:terminase large subunit [Acidobacteriota bacterium]
MVRKKPTSSRSSQKKSGHAPAQTKLSGVERAARYVEAVFSGKQVACKWVKLACKRQRDDLRKSKRKDFRWHYDEYRANRFIKFHEGLPHVKDDFLGHAKHREKFHLEDWQCFIYCSIFGWVDKEKGFRRFNDAYVEVPRKNGKTPGAAAVLLYGLCCDGEYGAEIFAGASSKDQAAEVFDAARAMVLASPELRAAYKVWVNVNSLVIQEKNASFKKLKGKPVDGPAPHMVSADEYHEYPTNRLIEWARNGMVGRFQPLLFRITTAGTDTASPCYETHLEAQEVLEGRRKSDRFFTVIYTIDKGVDWKSKRALAMANPNLGVSVNPEQIQEDQFQARQSATKQAAFKTKNENIWLNAAQPWMNMERWDECYDADLRLEDFAGDPCIIGIDLASKKDTVSEALLFKRGFTSGRKDQEGNDLVEYHYYCFTRHYLNSEQVQEEKNTHFRDWKEKGFLIETEGTVTDYVTVTDDLVNDANNLIVRELVFDPLHAAPLVQFMQKRSEWPQNIEIVDLKQSEEHMSPSMKELEAAVLSKRFHHNGNECLTWMIGNTRCLINKKTENWFPVRENVQRKIDGTVAIVLGMNRLMTLELETYQSTEIRWV